MKEKVKALRAALFLSQGELAKKIGVNRNTITNYEVGRRKPRFLTLKALIDLAKSNNLDIDFKETAHGDQKV